MAVQPPPTPTPPTRRLVSDKNLDLLIQIIGLSLQGERDCQRNVKKQEFKELLHSLLVCTRSGPCAPSAGAELNKGGCNSAVQGRQSHDKQGEIKTCHAFTRSIAEDQAAGETEEGRGESGLHRGTSLS